VQLVTIKKVTDKVYAPPTFNEAMQTVENEKVHIPAHQEFRDKYFNAFKKVEGSQDENQDTGKV
jgi:tRNA (guanine10-N2)-methyltransferase